MTDDPLKVPKHSAGDVAIAAVRGAAGFVPYVGPAAVEFVNLLLKAPLERRRDKWMEQMAERLKSLESQGIDLAALQNEEAFVDVVMQATQIAMRNHQDEKREALGNAISNSAGPQAPEESKRQIFLHAIDVLTVWHIRILKLIADPRQWFAANQKQPPSFGISALVHLIEAAFQELAGEKQRDLRDLLWKDLKDFGFHRTDGLHTMMDGNSIWVKRTTPLGNEFLNFIATPPASTKGSGTESARH